MEKLYAKSFCIVLAIALVGGESLLDSTSIELARQFPSFTLIQADYNDRLCGGVIINEQHVLTSGFCVGCINSLRQTDIWVYFDLSTKFHRIPVSKIYLHTDNSTNEHDIAILKLTDKFQIDEDNRPDIAPVKMSFSSYREQKSCSFLSWSRISASDSNYPYYALNKTILDTQPKAQCDGEWLSEEWPMFCATILDRHWNVSCAIDKGSALFCNQELIGIYQHRHCYSSIRSILFVKIRSRTQWILETLERSNNEDVILNSAATSTISVTTYIVFVIAVISLLATLH